MKLPAFTQTIRFRLTVLYSTVLFVLLATALGVTYVAVERTTDPKPITKRFEAELYKQKYGQPVRVGTLEVAAVEEIESEVNLRTLDALRDYSVAVLGGLFLLSLGVGWVVSGRALRPVRSISAAAQDIQATDLSRRIELGGPQDELHALAGTIDSMLERLEKAFASQRQLIDDASHELRTPLAIIRANLDATLSQEQGPDQAERRQAVQVIDRATTRMSRLVEDLLATARVDADALVDTEVSLPQVAAEAVDDVAQLAAAGSVRVARPAGPGPAVLGDPDALRRAVSNLLSNAVRLAPPGTAVTVTTGTDRDGAWVAVRDEGPGIEPADQERVFDRFWRTQTPPHGTALGRPERRTGLGLAIVRQIAESHGGRVTVDSEPGRGSTFTIRLPKGPSRSAV